MSTALKPYPPLPDACQWSGFGDLVLDNQWIDDGLLHAIRAAGKVPTGDPLEITVHYAFKGYQLGEDSEDVRRPLYAECNGYRLPRALFDLLYRTAEEQVYGADLDALEGGADNEPD